MSKIEVLVKNLTTIGEGPHFDEGLLYYVDIIGNSVGRYDTGSGKNVFIKVPGGTFVSFITPIGGSDGSEFLIGHDQTAALAKIDWDEGKVLDVKPVYITDAKKENARANDGKCDPWGRFWFGTMGVEEPGKPGVLQLKQGSLYRLDERGGKKMIDNIDISNGLTWDSDRKVMYYIDSLAKTLDAFDYDVETGDIRNRRVVYNLEEGGRYPVLDGMTIDTRGHLWVAMFRGSRVIEVDPAAKKVVSEIRFENADMITSCAFGGPNLDELYVTSGRIGDNTLPEAGSIFRVTGLGAGVKGIAMNKFPRETLNKLMNSK